MRGQTPLSYRESRLFDTTLGFQSKERLNQRGIPKVFKQKSVNINCGKANPAGRRTWQIGSC